MRFRLGFLTVPVLPGEVCSELGDDAGDRRLLEVVEKMPAQFPPPAE